MYGIIYKATGPTGLVYIGQTIKTLAKRKGNHAYCMKKGGNNNAFQAALLALGFSSFTWEQIDTADNAAELDAKEKHWITSYKSDDPAHGYNLQIGPNGRKQSKETRQKISEGVRKYLKEQGNKTRYEGRRRKKAANP
jgi:group I intron endonuclease